VAVPLEGVEPPEAGEARPLRTSANRTDTLIARALLLRCVSDHLRRERQKIFGSPVQFAVVFRPYRMKGNVRPLKRTAHTTQNEVTTMLWYYTLSTFSYFFGIDKIEPEHS